MPTHAYLTRYLLNTRMGRKVDKVLLFNDINRCVSCKLLVTRYQFQFILIYFIGVVIYQSKFFMRQVIICPSELGSNRAWRETIPVVWMLIYVHSCLILGKPITGLHNNFSRRGSEFRGSRLRFWVPMCRGACWCQALALKHFRHAKELLKEVQYFLTNQH